jgi:hypothetical protein
MQRLSLFLVPAIILFTSCATPNQTARSEPKFTEEASADIVVRFYSEQISRVLKPLQTEGTFLSNFNKHEIVDLAKQQSGRDLAVVILLQFNASDAVKRDWLTMLHGVGYKRIVFLRAQSGMKINGLPILENPSEITDQQKTVAGPHV